ncbi:hypothetical protein [Spiroplasma endosymbiont of Ammophila pubescens]|uniref:hypothetical protein n=1 Tax=Spiroplasma endosymbiont of Ammophila pubescens TaxID=3066315 RepID=UPI0032B2A4F0
MYNIFNFYRRKIWKKWLILLGTFGIVATFETTIFGCSIKMKLTEEEAENELFDDLHTLENISFEVKNYLQNNTFLNDIEI